MGKFFAWVKGLFTNGKRIEELEAEVKELREGNDSWAKFCGKQGDSLQVAQSENAKLRNQLHACRLTLIAVAQSKVKDEPGFRNTSSLAIRQKEMAQKVIDELWPAEGAAKS